MAIVRVGQGPGTRPVTGGDPQTRIHVNTGPTTAAVAAPPITRPGGCNQLNSKGKPCGAPPANGVPTCIGHQRKLGLV